MAKPEKHPWAYGPQWNYYPPHVLNFPKPLPLGSEVKSYDRYGNYHGIRCPEPRRPYQVPYPNFSSYYHPETHAAGSYIQSPTLYHPKQYFHRPVPHENFSSAYKYNENVQSYPTCSNSYSVTKDERSSNQTFWNSTSQYKRKTPELDVRRFLATWQEKDDDITDGATEMDEQKNGQVFEPNSIPLDCSKRNTVDKIIRKPCESFLTGQSPSTTGCVVQPYCIKDSSVPLQRTPFLNPELNNNIPLRGNLNYKHNNSCQDFQSKNFYANTDYWTESNEKYLSCEQSSFSYTQQINYCDNNFNHLRNDNSYHRQKDNILDTSERSHYNLTSSLESGDLFCDINCRSEDTLKQSIHSSFAGVHSRDIVNERQPYFNSRNDMSNNLIYTDLHPVKEPWDIYSTQAKYKDSVKCSENPKCINRLLPHSEYESHLVNSNTNKKNSKSGIYGEGFSIPGLNDTTVPENNSIQYNNNKNNVVDANTKSSIPMLPSSSKVSPTINKCVQENSKIKPYQFSEEISSDDIDISIASSGDLVGDEEQSIVATVSVINFSHGRKEKNNNFQPENNKECSIINSPDMYPVSLFSEKPDKHLLTGKEISENMVSNSNIALEDSQNDVPPKCCLKIPDTTSSAVVDLSTIKPSSVDKQTIEHEKNGHYLDTHRGFSENNHADCINVEHPTSPMSNKLLLQENKITTNRLSPFSNENSSDIIHSCDQNLKSIPPLDENGIHSEPQCKPIWSDPAKPLDEMNADESEYTPPYVPADISILTSEESFELHDQNYMKSEESTSDEVESQFGNNSSVTIADKIGSQFIDSNRITTADDVESHLKQISEDKIGDKTGPQFDDSGRITTTDDIETRLEEDSEVTIGDKIGSQFWDSDGITTSDDVESNLEENTDDTIGDKIGSKFGDSVGITTADDVESHLEENSEDITGYSDGITTADDVSQLEESREGTIGDKIDSQFGDSIGIIKADNPKSHLAENSEVTIGNKIGSQFWDSDGITTSDDVESHLEKNSEETIGDKIGLQFGDSNGIIIADDMKPHLEKNSEVTVGDKIGSQFWDSDGITTPDDVESHLEENSEDIIGNEIGSQFWDSGGITTADDVESQLEENCEDIIEDKIDSDFGENGGIAIGEDVDSQCRETNLDEYTNFSVSNNNLLLLAHCSQEYGTHFMSKFDGTQSPKNDKQKSTEETERNENLGKDNTIKCSLRWDKIFNVKPDNDQADMSLDLGPAKVELRLPYENHSTGQWKIVEADNKVQASSIVQVRRLILKRNSQSEGRIPKMVIKKTDGQVYRSYLKREPNETVLNAKKPKIAYDISSKSKHRTHIQDPEK